MASFRRSISTAFQTGCRPFLGSVHLFLITLEFRRILWLTMVGLSFSWPHCKRQTLAARRNSICHSNVFKIRKSWTTLRRVCLKQTQARYSSFNSPSHAVLPLFWLLKGQWLQLKSRVARALARAWHRTLGRGSRRQFALNRCSWKGAN